MIRKFGNNWIKSMEEGGRMCFDYRLETLGGWKVGEEGGGDWEFPGDGGQRGRGIQGWRGGVELN